MKVTKKRIPETGATYAFVFGYLEEQKPFAPEMQRIVLRSYEATLKKNRAFSWLFSYIAFKPTPKVKYIFFGTKFRDLLQGLPQDEVMVIGFLKDWLYCFWHRIPFASGMPVMKEALSCATSGSLRVSHILPTLWADGKNNSSRYLVLNNDSLPAERIYCVCAQSTGFSTVCIQHGIFTSNSPPRIYDGGVADRILVFDNHQRDFMIRGGIPAEKIGVMGFHSNVAPARTKLLEGTERRVCFLGQPWGAYYPDKETRYLELVDEVISSLKSACFQLFFKPHPNERSAEYLSRYECIELTSLKQCFGKFDVFISFTSTGLLEASLAGKVAIQIFDPQFFADRFENYGYSYSLDSDRLDELAKLVKDTPPMHLSYEGAVASRFMVALHQQ